MRIRNTFIIFLVSGFWHGANWTFIVWGFLNALFILPAIITKTNRNHINIVAEGKIFPSLKELFQILITFGLTVFAWIFFRAENMSHALSYIHGILSPSLFSFPKFKGMETVSSLFVLIVIFLIIEWKGRENQYALEGIKNINLKSVRWFIYLIILFIIYFYGNFGGTIEFIYFQF